MDIKKDLHSAEVDPAELVRVIASFLPTSIGGKRQTFTDPKGVERLAVEWTRKGKIHKIEPIGRMSRADIALLAQAVVNACLTTGAREVSRCILMRSAPLAGYLRVDQSLQLLPVPAEAPQPPDGVRAYHACILEVAVETSANRDITELRVHRAQMRTWALLNALLRAHLTRFDRRGPILQWPPHRRWIIRTADHGIPDETGQTWAVENHWEGYGYVGFEPRASSFLATGDLPPVPRLPREEYYVQLGGTDTAGAAPEGIDELVRAYYSLTPDERQAFDRAAHWFEYASATEKDSFSAAVLMYVMAIEALVPRAKGAPRCPRCNAETVGPTKRFKAFIEEIVPEAASDPYVQRLYEARSKLAHGSAILNTDFDTDPWSREAAEALFQFVPSGWAAQLALVNWLKKRSSLATASD